MGKARQDRVNSPGLAGLINSGGLWAIGLWVLALEGFRAREILACLVRVLKEVFGDRQL